MFDTLPGFREFYPEACARRNHIFTQWKRVARSFGFAEYDPPILEPLELYIEKSGEEIVSQLFNFEDKGGRAVALRPELTPSLARLVGSKAGGMKRPIKWFAIGENFRYEKPQKGRLRSHYQLNGDILGEAGPGADAELIALCLSALLAFGLTERDIVLRLSDRNLWMLYLEAMGLQGSDALKVLAVIDKMERLPREAVLEKLQPLFNDAAPDFLAKIETLVAIRSLEELTAFLKAHVTSPALQETLSKRLADWAELLSRLTAYGLGNLVRVDLGIVRGLAYYTGFVFEVFELSENGLRGRALAGGGRYDHLVKKLGYQDLPAVGFGMGDVTLTDLLTEKQLLPAYVESPEVYVIVAGQQERLAALPVIATLRHNGIRVEYPLKDTAFGKQFKAAGESGARVALIYGSDELRDQTVKLKDLINSTETCVPAGNILDAIGWYFAHGELPMQGCGKQDCCHNKKAE